MNKQVIWDFWAKHYENLWVQKYSLRPTRREVLSNLKDKLKADKNNKILDVGCGTGQLLRELKSRFTQFKLELLGIDFSKEMIQQAIEKDNTINYQHLDVRNISSISGIDEKFNFVLCTHSFPYYENQAKAIRQFADFLKDGGYLLLAQSSQNSFYDKLALAFVKLTTGKANYPSVNSILKMTKTSFECERIIKINEQFFMPSIYLFVLAKRTLHEGIKR